MIERAKAATHEAADGKGRLAPPDVFTIDVEDWFHIMEVEGTPQLDDWETMPPRLEQNLRGLLDLLDESGVKATCFVLGWVAARYPALLREAVARGHEIASHGYAHQLVHRIGRAAFRADILRARKALEDAIGVPVVGYRAPGFSITAATPWAAEELAGAGYLYDSSVFPGVHGHGGLPDAPRGPYRIETEHGPLLEFPMSVLDTPRGGLCLFGGGYLRLFPWPLIALAAARVRRQGRGVMWYIHPREIDPDHPRLPMSATRRFKSYVNLAGTAPKLRRVLGGGRFATLGELAGAG